MDIASRKTSWPIVSDCAAWSPQFPESLASSSTGRRKWPSPDQPTTVRSPLSRYGKRRERQVFVRGHGVFSHWPHSRHKSRALSGSIQGCLMRPSRLERTPRNGPGVHSPGSGIALQQQAWPVTIAGTELAFRMPRRVVSSSSSLTCSAVQNTAALRSRSNGDSIGHGIGADYAQ